MEFISTKNSHKKVSFQHAVFHSLPSDNGLYMPVSFPKLSSDFFKKITTLSFPEISFEVAHALLGDSIEKSALKNIIDEAINFPAPTKEIEKNTFVLELFHGPSMAFKDFGARFMSRVMSYFLRDDHKELEILVATSGDTGGAVALGFYDVPGIKVTILFPKGKVSSIQEKQLTTLGKNIRALEVDGTFDDCQKLVKTAFLDKDIASVKNLSSANSINIARLIPQMFYYFNAYAEIRRQGNDNPVIFSVPSGNFGNLTAGLFAKKMGLPVAHFVAATNSNDEVPQYLRTGIFHPKPSVHTLSNAMDVGNPSNFQRMLSLYHHDVDEMRRDIDSYSFSDTETLQAIDRVWKQDHYIMCPHTATAYLGLKSYLKDHQDLTGVFLSSAHPCKFPNAYSDEMWKQVEIPEQAKDLETERRNTYPIANDFKVLKHWLLKH